MSIGSSSIGRRVQVVALVAFLGLLSLPRATEAQAVPERSGFTMLLSLGAGYQNDALFEESAFGLGGLNLGIGGFLNDRMALWFRASGTMVTYDFEGLGELRQTSGFGGPAVQYWVSDRFAVEGGVGVGFWSVEDGGDETGLGLMLGGDYVVWTNGGHSLHLGIEYAPSFADPDTVHNLGFVFGWQLN